MKFSAAISTGLIVLPALTGVSAGVIPRQGNIHQRRSGNGGNAGNHQTNPASAYRLSTLASSQNHQPVIVPVAQRGAQADVIHFTVAGTAGGAVGGAAPANPRGKQRRLRRSNGFS